MKKVYVISVLMVFFVMMFTNCGGGRDSSKFPTSNLTYTEAENEVGGGSKLTDDKRDDVFDTKYKDHWFTWEGEVVLADADNASVNIDGVGTQDLHVDFADEQAGYDLKIGDRIIVRFVMTSMGGSFLPFGGEDAIIVKNFGDSRDASKFPVSNLNYSEAENEVGGNSKLTDNKKDDIFNAKYKNHWFTWEGEVVSADADNVSINIDGVGTSDLAVDFADEKAGYDLKIGDRIKVRFVMTSMGGAIFPFHGEEASIVP